MNNIHVLVADNHALFREGMCRMIESTQDMAVVGEAQTGVEAVRLALEQQPDVVLMDIQMPQLNGIAAAEQILAQLPNMCILMLTMFDDDQLVFKAMKMGARGYILKGTKRMELLRMIRLVHAGGAVFSHQIAIRMMQFFSRIQTAPTTRAKYRLSQREREVLHLLTIGSDNGEIAEHMHISEKTVRNYVSRILNKLQVATRAELVERDDLSGW